MRLPLPCLVFFLMNAASSVQAAESGSGIPPSDSGTYQFDLQSGLSALKGLLSMADLYVNEYFDIDAQMHPGSPEAKSWGKLHFKFYPKGRSQSEEGVDADTWFKSDNGEWSFHFNLRDPQQNLSESSPQL